MKVSFRISLLPLAQKVFVCFFSLLRKRFAQRSFSLPTLLPKRFVHEQSLDGNRVIVNLLLLIPTIVNRSLPHVALRASVIGFFPLASDLFISVAFGPLPKIADLLIRIAALSNQAIVS